MLTRVQPYRLSGYRALLASLAGATFTAACAQVAFYLPGNPVPITMQVFAVLCCGMLLGSRLGALSQLEYIAAGMLGAPVFAGFKTGAMVVAGPTVGYVAGFVVAAFVVGLFLEMAAHRTFTTACMAGIAGVAVVYVFGAGWLARTTSLGLGGWVLGAAPFVGVDVVKAVLAAMICVGRRYP